MTRAETQRTMLSGYGFYSAYADSAAGMIAGLAAGRRITSRPYFATDTEATSARLTVNPHYVPLPQQPQKSKTLTIDFIERQMLPVVEQALRMAKLDAESLSSRAVRVYIAGNGVRANLADFAGYQDRNDIEDLLFFPQIKALSSANYAQDALMHRLTRHYRLAWAPIPLYSASSSGMSALHLAQEVINHGQVDVALVIGWMDLTLQDVLFLGGQNMLTGGNAQPFAAASNGVLPSNGVTAIVLESERHCRGRGIAPDIALHSSATYQSSGARGSHSFSADFRSIALTMEKVLEQAELRPEEIACVFPHGNGIYSSDKAEAMAIRKIWGAEGVPVVSYKSQFGYFSTCSGLVDVMIAADALRERRLLAFGSQHELDRSLQLDFHVNSAARALRSRHILKSSLGLEGSVVACALSLIAADESRYAAEGAG